MKRIFIFICWLRGCHGVRTYKDWCQFVLGEDVNCCVCGSKFNGID